jgi:hypothetical protein
MPEFHDSVPEFTEFGNRIPYPTHTRYDRIGYTRIWESHTIPGSLSLSLYSIRPFSYMVVGYCGYPNSVMGNTSRVGSYTRRMGYPNLVYFYFLYPKI